MTYITNVITIVIYVRNIINKLIIVFKYIKFDKISNFEKKNCYHVDLTISLKITTLNNIIIYEILSKN